MPAFDLCETAWWSGSRMAFATDGSRVLRDASVSIDGSRSEVLVQGAATAARDGSGHPRRDCRFRMRRRTLVLGPDGASGCRQATRP